MDVEAGPCGRGFVVVSSDYHSTNVALVDFDGRLLTPSLVSSATEQARLSAPLSGDVVVPTELMAGERIVLLDRLSTDVVSWIDLKSATFAAQLPVRTGFSSNPRDYVEVSPRKAYVTRYESNPRAGSEPFDQGNDLMIIDPGGPEIVGRIDLSGAILPEEAGVLPRADRALSAGGRVLAVLSSMTGSFDSFAPSRIAVVDPQTDALEQVLVLPGLSCCSGIALSPSGQTAAVACLGDCATQRPTSLERSGIAVLDVGPPLQERGRIQASELGLGIIGFFADFASEDHLLTVTLGNEDTALDDAVVELDLSTGAHKTLLKGVPFSLGEVRCAPECGVCFVADAAHQGGILQRFEVGTGAAAEPQAIRLEDGIGLPPRYLGRF